MILIGSAAYIGEDLSIEVGRLPPAFLPIGNRRLYEYQVEFLSSLDGKIYLSIPESFDLPTFDADRLEELNVKIIRVPDGLTLGNSVAYCWSASGVEFTSLTLLHGDTLLLGFPLNDTDCLSAHENMGSYERARISPASNCVNLYESEFVDDDQLVISGYFRFSRPQLLIQGILEKRGDFIGAIGHYSERQGVDQISSGKWMDFGHLNSFFTSRSLMTTQRSFNDLEINTRTVKKSSVKKIKMKAEANWFKCLPSRLQIHVPPLLGEYCETDTQASYSIEYLYLIPLSDLIVFGAMSKTRWRHIFEAAYNVLHDFRECTDYGCCNPRDAHQLYLPKTIDRLKSLENSQFQEMVDVHAFAKGSNLINIASIASSYISETTEANVAIVHGDFCFSNILFDSRTAALKLIDPRGMNSEGELCVYGDQRYDVAKMYHSIAGRYDFIIAGRYEIVDDRIIFPDESKILELEGLFESVFFESGKFDKTEIAAINILLFFSMIPLHSDRPDRQHAMLLNAYRLYKKLLGNS